RWLLQAVPKTWLQGPFSFNGILDGLAQVKVVPPSVFLLLIRAVQFQLKPRADQDTCRQALRLATQVNHDAFADGEQPKIYGQVLMIFMGRLGAQLKPTSYYDGDFHPVWQAAWLETEQQAKRAGVEIQLGDWQ